MAVLTILGLLALFLIPFAFFMRKLSKKDTKSSNSSAESSELFEDSVTKPIPTEEFEGEKFEFEIKDFCGWDEKTGQCSQTFLDCLNKRASAHPSRTAYIWLDKDANETARISYGELRNAVAGFAAEKLNRFVKPGDDSDDRPKAMVILPPCIEYNVAFLALLSSKFIAVPVYPPKDFAKDSGRVTQIAKSTDAKYIISTKAIYYKIFAASMLMGDFHPTDYTWIYIDDIQALKKRYTTPLPLPRISPDIMAYIQCTSGSTSAPKGVKISHRNIIAQNLLLIDRFIPNEGEKRFGPKVPKKSHFTFLAWVPPYHDFGLLTGVFLIGLGGGTHILYSALDFIANPKNWLIAMYKYQPMFTVSPNFGYNLICALPKAIKTRYPIPYFTTLACGAEPINPKTMYNVVRDFGDVNLCPGFGLAEFTLASAAQKDGKWETAHLVKSSFEKRIVEVVEREKERARYKHDELIELVSCGVPAFEAQHRIVDPETLQELPPNRVGELILWDRTGNKPMGYYKNKEATEATFNVHFTDLNGKRSEEGWVRTGDLAFMYKNGLYICGRQKDLIIICGRNIYPHDVEATTIEAKPDCICKGGAIAFSVSHYKGVEEEQLAIVCEINEETKQNPSKFPEIYNSIVETINDKFQAKPSFIVLLKENDLPRTASHKVSRAPCKKMLLEKKLAIIDAFPSKEAVM